jgi:hypothetical protein
LIPPHRSSDRRRSLIASAILAVPLVLGWLASVDAESARWFGVEGPACTWRSLFGELACPGCGLTRSTALVVQGDWRLATALHPAGFAVVAACLGGLLVHGHVLLRGRRGPWHERLLSWGRRGFVAALLAAWGVRIL